ncbi:hypothetical protein SLEP1_g15865 [Rubroshorea leprosula]|uniref:Uncharacterized protein n=1 Tax=Rubroshorea leprosula TaxID=152421 RepID=A0AAV5IY73_9ROSI|nr:hypothetical protein SLEP1_g15865 [Rubroshorea leprosula]
MIFKGYLYLTKISAFTYGLFYVYCIALIVCDSIITDVFNLLSFCLGEANIPWNFQI